MNMYQKMIHSGLVQRAYAESVIPRISDLADHVIGNLHERPGLALSEVQLAVTGLRMSIA